MCCLNWESYLRLERYICNLNFLNHSFGVLAFQHTNHEFNFLGQRSRFKYVVLSFQIWMLNCISATQLQIWITELLCCNYISTSWIEKWKQRMISQILGSFQYCKHDLHFTINSSGKLMSFNICQLDNFPECFICKVQIAQPDVRMEKKKGELKHWFVNLGYHRDFKIDHLLWFTKLLESSHIKDLIRDIYLPDSKLNLADIIRPKIQAWIWVVESCN